MAKAPPDTTCTIYRGPGTSTPYQVRVSGLPCRLVDDPYFRANNSPLIDSVSYFTNTSVIPNGPVTTDAGAGLWQYDYSRADRVEFANNAGVLFICAEVLTCTGPAQAPYWRSELIETTETPLTPCQRLYRGYYEIQFDGGFPTVIAYRIGPTLWQGGGVLLQAEGSGPPGLSCMSQWNVAGHGFYTSTANGQSAWIANSITTPGQHAYISPGPP